MKRPTRPALVLPVVLLGLGFAAPGATKVERIELDIAGYLCGF